MPGPVPPTHGATPPPAPDPSGLDAEIERLCRHLGAIDTDQLRSRTAATELAHRSPPEVVLLLGRLLRAARDRPSAAVAVHAVSRALARGHLDPDQVDSWLAAARSRADRVVEALLAAGPALRTYDVDEEPFVDRKMRSMPLGQRRALAKTRDVDQLLRLAHDQDPRVIRQLLQNPRLTEREAVLIASRRPTQAHVLEEVLASRFGTLVRVRLSVAHNPYAPLALALRALTGLPATALRDVAASERVSEPVRRHARALLVARRPLPSERASARPPPPDGDPQLDELLAALADDDADDVTLLDEDGYPR